MLINLTLQKKVNQEQTQHKEYKQQDLFNIYQIPKPLWNKLMVIY